MNRLACKFLRPHAPASFVQRSFPRMQSTVRQESDAFSPLELVSRQRNICIVGAGRMGAIRAKNLYCSPQFKLAAIVDDAQARCDSIADIYGVASYSTLSEALECEDLDAVWIATPTSSHKELINLAAKNKIAVGVEKPVSDNEIDIEQCYRICQENGVPLMCSFQRRYDPNYDRVVQMVREGQLGKLSSIHTVFRDFPVPPVDFLLKGGCIFHDCAVHDIDFVRHLTGEEPCEVFAKGTSTLEPLKAKGIADQAHIMFTFPSGLVYTMEVSRSSPFGYDNRLEVCGSSGVAQVENLPANSVVHSRGTQVISESPLGSFPERYQQAYQNEIDSFAQVVQMAQQPLITCRDALRATILAESARVSALKGIPVPIPNLE